VFTGHEPRKGNKIKKGAHLSLKQEALCLKGAILMRYRKVHPLERTSLSLDN